MRGAIGSACEHPVLRARRADHDRRDFAPRDRDTVDVARSGRTLPRSARGELSSGTTEVASQRAHGPRPTRSESPEAKTGVPVSKRACPAPSSTAASDSATAALIVSRLSSPSQSSARPATTFSANSRFESRKPSIRSSRVAVQIRLCTKTTLRLADAVGAVGRLVLDGRVPPRVEVDDGVGGGQVEARRRPALAMRKTGGPSSRWKFSTPRLAVLRRAVEVLVRDAVLPSSGCSRCEHRSNELAEDEDLVVRHRSPGGARERDELARVVVAEVARGRGRPRDCRPRQPGEDLRGWLFAVPTLDLAHDLRAHLDLTTAP